MGRWGVGGLARSGLGRLCWCCGISHQYWYLTYDKCVYIPGNKIKPHRSALGFGVGSNSRVEEKKDRCSLEHELPSISKLSKNPSLRQHLTDWKVFFPSIKSNVPKISLLSLSLSPFVHVLANRSHSGWKSLHKPHPNLASRAVRRIAAE